MSDDNRVKLSIKFEETEYKKIMQFCKVENRISFQDFIHFAVNYCVKNKILPGDKK
jgi:hypothetical protein